MIGRAALLALALTAAPVAAQHSYARAARPDSAPADPGNLTEAPALAQVTVMQAPAFANVTVLEAPAFTHVTFSKAADALGEPVDFSRFMSSALRSSALKGSRMPLGAATLTSGFGMRWNPVLGGIRPHLGIDLAAPAGTPIYATADGIVGKAQWQGGYGLLVALEHGAGLETRYGHMSRLNVATGQHVHRGDIIGFVGSTGNSTGPHLHYETRVNGQAVNPVPPRSK